MLPASRANVGGRTSPCVTPAVCAASSAAPTSSTTWLTCVRSRTARHGVRRPALEETENHSRRRRSRQVVERDDVRVVERATTALRLEAGKNSSSRALGRITLSATCRLVRVAWPHTRRPTSIRRWRRERCPPWCPARDRDAVPPWARTSLGQLSANKALSSAGGPGRRNSRRASTDGGCVQCSARRNRTFTPRVFGNRGVQRAMAEPGGRSDETQPLLAATTRAPRPAGHAERHHSRQGSGTASPQREGAVVEIAEALRAARLADQRLERSTSTSPTPFDRNNPSLRR